MAILQSVLQHRSIGFLQDVASDFDDQIRANSNYVGVKGSVMNLAER
jgi:hypothetical protein